MRHSTTLALVFLALALPGLHVAPGQPAREAPPPRTAADFRPSLHGFRFVNAFAGSSLPPPLDRVHLALAGPMNFGLCGGMTAAAADLFHAGRTPLSAAQPPPHGTALFAWLRARQIDSFGPDFAEVLRFARWARSPIEGIHGTRAATASQLAPILDRLERGELVPLGLVYTGREDRRPIWHNHQVLAYAAERRPERHAVIIRIYDPNEPLRDDVSLECRLYPSGLTMNGGPRGIVPACMVSLRLGGRAQGVRGVFAMPYHPRPLPPGIR